MKTILITGGAGFVGSNLCVRLLDEGNRIICVDNFLTSSKENINPFLGNSNFKFIEHDIINPLFIDESIDEIYNLACPASPVHYQNNAIRTIKANTVGVINILGLARAKNAKIFQASTSEVYGDPIEHPQKESYRGNVNPDGPRACYDEGKRCAETLFFDYYRTHDLKIKVVRIFNTYGPNMAPDDGRVVSNFIIQALKGEDITIYGDGSQTRSFCYVDDLVGGFIKMMASDENTVGPINLGNPDEFTVSELAHKVIELTGSKSKLVYNDLPVDDPTRRCPDISLAKEILKWEPKIKLQEGLLKTIAYFKSVI
ncbi:MAG: NAD-dependent dehydratase [Candidatus Magasanikbacteria bacterium RIFOXYD2_FULL_36_9]|uniref:UDP-glucuronate decarboxylase n=1 Tax=Candidatus Magasanikbacteria bacterium RIFOXYD2_FULL_36_9 TaxID=1798707 RepID=A0A1F6P163_9BACT|nr:MAG: NAD-dependent dehydratase [Candidatus Magasanikbacteria bacterium RIFOXYD2_FULL_36_9]